MPISKFKSLRILLAGGAVFIGSHLCKRLLEDGHDVIIPLYVVIDHISNLAYLASPVNYQHDPVQTTKTSVHVAINMLGLAKRNYARTLQASTGEVYRDQNVHPQQESYWMQANLLGIRSSYDEAKQCAETLLFDYYHKHKMPIRVVRMFNAYGPNMRPSDSRLVSNFIVQALRDVDITIGKDVSQMRSFQYADHLVDSLVGMMESDKGFVGSVNMGNTSEFAIQELAEVVLQIIPKRKRNLFFRPLSADDPRQRQQNISLAKKKLRWAPSSIGAWPRKNHSIFQKPASVTIS